MKYCWSCGAELRGTNPQFCSECGIKLDDGKPTPTPIRTVGGTGNVNVTITNSFREAQRLYQINEYELALTYINDAIEEDSEKLKNEFNAKISVGITHTNEYQIDYSKIIADKIYLSDGPTKESVKII